jgi:phospholipid/cholesterol/gamma-HCH transport system substrate-binding protein
MQNYTRFEISVGAFVCAGALALAYLAFTLGGVRLSSGDRYPLTARFSSVGSLKRGDPVKIAGVNIGEVADIHLADFHAQTELLVNRELKLPADTIASIQSAGLLGDAYVSLSPGASDRDLAAGGSINRTESAINLIELVAKYAFGAAPGTDASASDQATPKPSSGSTAPASAAQQSRSFLDPLE